MATDTRHEGALLLFSLGPVQSFIEASRSVRDLWTGSYLLSWLTFHAMQPVVAEIKQGRADLIFPQLNGNPLQAYVDGGPEDENLKSQRRLPCLPNRFLAQLADPEQAKAMETACQQAARDAWEAIHTAVRDALADQVEKKFSSDPELSSLAADWDAAWTAQCDSFFELSTACLRFDQCSDELAKNLLGSQTHAGDDNVSHWLNRWELLGKLHRSQRSVRHFPPYALPAGQVVPHKCSLLGSYEQMGPAITSESKDFWKHFAEQVRIAGARTHRTERLCAISLVKRFAWPAYFSAYFSKQLKTRVSEHHYADTATVAAVQWLAEHEPLNVDEAKSNKNQRSWSGQWLHWTGQHDGADRGEDGPSDTVWQTIRRKKKAQGSPPIYYAVLMLDGDNMGELLRGTNGIVGPERQQKISATVSDFALRQATRIVQDHSGQLIYAGGDDVLAMLPTATALSCAPQLSKAFTDGWPADVLHDETGGKATVSAGIAVVHYKEDLRFALRAARQAEKKAKNAGRNAVAVTVCRRSGAHTGAICSWKFTETLEQWVAQFAGSKDHPQGASDRWTYHLAAELPTLRELPYEAIRAEVQRQVGRSQDGTIDREAVGRALEQYRNEFRPPASPPDNPSGGTGRAAETQLWLDGFVTLCQSASFLARGGKGR